MNTTGDATSESATPISHHQNVRFQVTPPESPESEDEPPDTELTRAALEELRKRIAEIQSSKSDEAESSLSVEEEDIGSRFHLNLRSTDSAESSSVRYVDENQESKSERAESSLPDAAAGIPRTPALPDGNTIIRFKDAIGRTYNFPWERCRRWRVSFVFLNIWRLY